MNTVRGTVKVKESGVGVPDLLVVVYDQRPGELPMELRDPGAWVQRGDFCEKLPGDRLGSVVTDENGEFELGYDDTAFQVRDGGRRPDLMLFVQAPEDCSAHPCPRILHVSGVRGSAGRMEHYFIKIPVSVLRQAGVLPNVARSTPLDTPDVGELQALLRSGAEHRTKADVKEPFSERYKARRARLRASSGPMAEMQQPPATFDVSVPKAVIPDGTVLSDAELFHDEASGQLMLRVDNQVVPLRFTGVKLTDALRDGLRVEGGSGWVIDPEKQEIHLLVASSPNSLTRPQSQPSQLQQWFLEQIRPRSPKASSTQRSRPRSTSGSATQRRQV